MRALFPDQPEVVEETQRVANLCEFDFAKRYFLPQYPRPAEFASDNDLPRASGRGRGRGALRGPCPGRPRALDYELQVISHTGYAGYFLIVYDIVKAAKDRGIPVGPGRLGAGSPGRVRVASRISIPSSSTCWFERFLNPERILDAKTSTSTSASSGAVRFIQYIRERLWPGLGRTDHHLWDAEGARRVPRRRADAAGRAG